jgi:hypothetical protein
MAVSTGAAMLGGAAVGLLGSKGSKQQNTTSTAKAEPWSGVQPHLLNLFGRADTLYNQGPYDYLANQSPLTKQAQDLTVQRSLDPNSLVSRSQGVLGDTISGEYLTPDSNPFLRGAVQDALGMAASTHAGQFGGAAGSNLSNSGYQESLARGLGAAATNAYANAYGQERQNQLQATQLAPTMDFANINPIAGVGAQQDAINQRQFMSPWENLSRYQGMLAGNFGGTTTQQTPYFTNPTAGALGGALMGGQLAGMLGGGAPAASAVGGPMALLGGGFMPFA